MRCKSSGLPGPDGTASDRLKPTGSGRHQGVDGEGSIVSQRAGGLRWGLTFVACAVVGLAAGGFAYWGFGSDRPPDWAEVVRDVNAGRWREAERQLERWIRVHPQQSSARVLLARVRLEQGKRGAAAAVLETIGDRDRPWLEAQMLLGEIELQERRAARAEVCFRRVAERDPRAVPPRQRLIYLLSLQGRNGEAREVFWQLYEILDDPRVLVDLVLELVKLREDARGLGPELREFLQETPDDPFLNRAYGMSLLLQGRAAEAHPHLQAAAQALENDPEGRFALAECCLALGQPVDEQAMLDVRPNESSERCDPIADSQTWLCRGRIRESLGNLEQAREAFLQAVALNPDNREARFRLARLLVRLGETELARSQQEAYEEAEARIALVRNEHSRLRRQGFENDAALFTHLGELCHRAGLVREARAWFDQALRIDPAYDSARLGRAAIKGDDGYLPIFLARPRLATRPREPADAPLRELTGATRRSQGVAGGQQGVATRYSVAPQFEEIAPTAGVTFQYDSGFRGNLHLVDTMGGGVGLIDYDRDGLLDLYFVGGCPFPFDPTQPPGPNRLYRNRGDGTFEDVTSSAGVAGRGYGMGCAVGDYDNDGDADLFVTGYGQTVLYRNRGDGTFEDVTAAAGVASTLWTTAAGFGDLDRDGDLDLVVITYVEIEPGEVSSCRDHLSQPIHCSPGRYPAQDDLLFRNNGDGTFTEISSSVGFVAPNGRGLGLAIADLEGDGDLDIFVANDASADFLFLNDGRGQFTESGAESGIAVNGSGLATASMGVVAEDLTSDGLVDLFITNFLNEPNTLFRNLGSALFADGTLGAGLDAPSRLKTGFGCAALDADNDGLLDLFVANGHVDDQPWVNSPMAQQPQFFWGLGRGKFQLAAGGEGYFSRTLVARGTAAGDLDNDGRIDLVVVHRDAPVSVLRNVTPSAGNWVGLQLRGTASARTPVGARAVCRVQGKTLSRTLAGGVGYLSVHDPRLWFGLGPAEQLDQLEITWPSGQTQSFVNLPVHQLLEIVEGRQTIEPIPLRRWGIEPVTRPQ